MTDDRAGSFTRRDFCKTAAAVSVAAVIPGTGVFAQGSDTFRVGVIGCGGRGTGAAIDCLKADPGGRNRRARRPRARPRREFPQAAHEGVPGPGERAGEPPLHRLRQLPRRLLAAPRSTSS